MKKNLFLCFVLLFVSGCSLRNMTNSNSDNLSNNDENSSGISSSNTLNESNSNIGPNIRIIIRTDFFYNEEHYLVDSDINISRNDLSDFFGYFINEEDLEKWTTFDNNSDLIYILDDDNTLLRKTIEENLENRFEVYSIKNSENIAVLLGSDIYVYTKAKDKNV